MVILTYSILVAVCCVMYTDSQCHKLLFVFIMEN